LNATSDAAPISQQQQQTQPQIPQGLSQNSLQTNIPQQTQQPPQQIQQQQVPPFFQNNFLNQLQHPFPQPNNNLLLCYYILNPVNGNTWNYGQISLNLENHATNSPFTGNILNNQNINPIPPPTTNNKTYNHFANK
jgi:hypothetical protein